MAVKPERSENRTVAWRRSPALEAGAVAGSESGRRAGLEPD